MASPVVTEVEDRDDEPPHVYGALVVALSRGDVHTVRALLLETGVTAEEGRGGEGGGDMCAPQVGSKRSRDCISPEPSVFEAVKRVLEVPYAYRLTSHCSYRKCICIRVFYLPVLFIDHYLALHGHVFSRARRAGQL
jgi:hypothetical protein